MSEFLIVMGVLVGFPVIVVWFIIRRIKADIRDCVKREIGKLVKGDDYV